MQKSAELPKLNDDLSFKGSSVDFVCNECGGTFQKPILATVLCKGKVQTYYACPLCMTRISKKRKENAVSKKDYKKPSTELENTVNCKHFLGYLKNRPKDVPVPEECLTCQKMIECLFS